MEQILIEQIAKVAHDTNRSFCQSIGDSSQLEWELAPQWQRASAIAGVKFHISNPNASASASHDSWLRIKLDDGWKYGPVKNVEKKEHPCCVDYSMLSLDQKIKDYLFKSVIHAFLNAMENESEKK